MFVCLFAARSSCCYPPARPGPTAPCAPPRSCFQCARAEQRPCTRLIRPRPLLAPPQLFSMLSPREQHAVMQLPEQQRPQAIVLLAERMKQRQLQVDWEGTRTPHPWLPWPLTPNP